MRSTLSLIARQIYFWSQFENWKVKISFGFNVTAIKWEYQDFEIDFVTRNISLFPL